MVSTYSPNLRIEEPAQGDYAAGWANMANNNYNLLDQAIAAITSVNVTGGSNVTLTSLNGASDEARSAVLVLKGTPSSQISVLLPNSVTKLYALRSKVTNTQVVVVNNAAAVGAGVTVAPDEQFSFYTDGVRCRKLGVVPKGTVNFWPNSAASIPPGWQAMSALYGSFLKMSGTAGVSTASTAPSVSIGTPASGDTGSTVLTVDQIPAHNHGTKSVFSPVYGSGSEDGLNQNVFGTSTTDTGGGLGHTHTLTGSHTHPIGVVGGEPQSYTLIPIQKYT